MVALSSVFSSPCSHRTIVPVWAQEAPDGSTDSRVLSAPKSTVDATFVAVSKEEFRTVRLRGMVSAVLASAELAALRDISEV